MKVASLVLGALALCSAPVLAQTSSSPQQMMQKMHDPRNPYGSAEMKMHERMVNVPLTDASEIWARKMIEHHRGAVDMSRIVLERTRDAEIRRMAQKSITEQQKDINELNRWLQRHGKRRQ